ncbi:MAG: hypothetical protein IJH20_06880 [Bacilli bacterium]|nr:hypothetical protein [Bacilli bacterium]
MGNLINLLEVTNSDLIKGKPCEPGSNTLFIFQIAYTVVLIIQIAVPFVLIVLGSIDFFKSVVAGDEKEMKQKRKPFVQRLIAAIVIFIIPFIVSLIITTFFKNSDFATCWTNAKDRNIDIPTADNILNDSNTSTNEN